MKTLYSVMTVAALAAGSVAAMPAAHAQTVVRGAASSTALTSDEQQHFMETMQTGIISLEASKIARVKAGSKWVKMFADSEVAEQETMADVLTSLAPTIKPPVLTKEGKAMIAKLNATEPGEAFDKLYVEGQLAGHRELLKAQDSYLDGGDVLAEVNVAKLARGQILDHIKALEAISSALAQ